MSRHALMVTAIAIAVGLFLLFGWPESVDENDPVDETSSPATDSAPSAPMTPPMTPPMTEWGEPDLAGVWRAAPLGASAGNDTFDLATLEGLYTAEARVRISELTAADDPLLICTPPAFPRAAMLGTPIQIFQRPGFAYVITEAYPVYRVIPTTDRGHTDEQFRFPNYMGDSSGRWEGDTLVVEVISFNGETWLAGPEDRPTATSTGAWPATDAMRVTERWRRVDADTLEYRATVEDPSSLSAPWETPAVTFDRLAVDRIEEVLCLQDDGPETYLDRVVAIRD